MAPVMIRRPPLERACLAKENTQARSREDKRPELVGIWLGLEFQLHLGPRTESGLRGAFNNRASRRPEKATCSSPGCLSLGGGGGGGDRKRRGRKCSRFSAPAPGKVEPNWLEGGNTKGGSKLKLSPKVYNLINFAAPTKFRSTFFVPKLNWAPPFWLHLAGVGAFIGSQVWRAQEASCSWAKQSA